MIIVDEQVDASDDDVLAADEKRIGEHAVSRVDDHGGLAPVPLSIVFDAFDMFLITNTSQMLDYSTKNK